MILRNDLVHFSDFKVIELGAKTHDFREFYPPGSKSVALQLGVHLILLYFIRISLLSAETFFPPGSKSVALQLGVHLIRLYFIRISLLITGTFFLFWWLVVGVGWWPTFWFFKSLDINVVHTLGVYVYI